MYIHVHSSATFTRWSSKDNMCQFFFGHRLCTSERHSLIGASPKCAANIVSLSSVFGTKDLVRWVHMASFDIHLFLGAEEVEEVNLWSLQHVAHVAHVAASSHSGR